MHPLKAAQRLERRAWNVREAQIELRHLVARFGPSISHRYFRNQWASRRHFGRNAKSAVTERRVTQPVPERIKRCPFKVAVSPSLHRVILERRQLVHAGIESYRQTARGIVAA